MKPSFVTFLCIHKTTEPYILLMCFQLVGVVSLLLACALPALACNPAGIYGNSGIAEKGYGGFAETVTLTKNEKLTCPNTPSGKWQLRFCVDAGTFGTKTPNSYPDTTYESRDSKDYTCTSDTCKVRYICTETDTWVAYHNDCCMETSVQDKTCHRETVPKGETFVCPPTGTGNQGGYLFWCAKKGTFGGETMPANDPSTKNKTKLNRIHVGPQFSPKGFKVPTVKPCDTDGGCEVSYKCFDVSGRPTKPVPPVSDKSMSPVVAVGSATAAAVVAAAVL